MTLTEIYEARVADGSLRPDPAQRAALPMLQELRDWLESQNTSPKGLLSGFLRRPRPPAPKGIYLWGGVGRGKSMLMDLFTDTVSISAKRRVHFHAFMQEIHRDLHEVRKTGVNDALAPVAAKVAAQVRLLAFDEMQITDITDAMIVGRLFKHLQDAGVIVVTTSNRKPEDLYKNGLNRQLFIPFIEHLNATMLVHKLESPNDYRQHRLEGAQVYFHPADASARRKIDQIWLDLAGVSKGAPQTLTVNNRTLVLDSVQSGVARATFWDLCARPLGPADFLSVAAAVRVLILEDIPRLSSANYNEAKRFVTLIDALYEAKVRLIASAADIPERLYLEGTGAFEFERTASRLREMQSADWAQDQPS